MSQKSYVDRIFEYIYNIRILEYIIYTKANALCDSDLSPFLTEFNIFINNY